MTPLSCCRRDSYTTYNKWWLRYHRCQSQKEIDETPLSCGSRDWLLAKRSCSNSIIIWQWWLLYDVVVVADLSQSTPSMGWTDVWTDLWTDWPPYPVWNRRMCVLMESQLTRALIRPTQSVMYVPLQVNRFAEYILFIVQYRYLKSFSGDIYSPESDPPHKIMRYWIYYSIWLRFSFPTDRICQVEIICTGGVPVSKRHFARAGP